MARRTMRTNIGAALAGFLSIVAVSALLRPFRGDLNTAVVALAYLSAVLLVASRAAPSLAIATALLAFTCFDFFFIRPYDTLRVDSTSDGLALLSFAIVAVAASEATVLLRQRARQAEERERNATALSAFSTLLLSETGTTGLPASVARSAGQLLDADACCILPVQNGELAALGSPEVELPPFVALDQVRQVLSDGSPRLIEQPSSGARTLYHPLNIEGRTLGVLIATGPLRSRDENQRQIPGMVEAVTHTLAVTLDRERLSAETAHLEALRRSDEFKTVLLAAISHDLKTPIAAIKAAVTGLLGADAHWDEQSRQAALRAVDDATDRLHHLVTGLLDLSRIEAGAVHPQLEWHDLQDLVGSAIATAGAVLDGHTVSVSLPDDLPLVRVDFVLVAQVLVNLLDNAARYAGSGSRIEVHACASPADVIVSVWDEGAGIPPTEREHVFEKFYRGASAGGTRPHGAGLGLAICRGLIERQGGRIWAGQSPLGGAAVSFSLPRLPDRRGETQSSGAEVLRGNDDSGRR
jgi:two-component system sensor histidine kinase KdpD